MTLIVNHLSGRSAGQVERFEQDRIRIGRRPDNDIRYDPDLDKGVSGHHAEIVSENGRLVVHDRQSTNGTFVNGRRITEPTPIGERDVVQFSPRGPEITCAIEAVATSADQTMAMPLPSAEARGRPTAPRQPAPSRPSPQIEEAPAPRVAAKVWALIGGAFALAAALSLLVYALLQSWWVVWIAVLVALVGVLAGVLGWWWWAGRHRDAPPEALATVSSIESVPLVTPEPRDGVSVLRIKWNAALQALRGSKFPGLARGSDPVYALPWFLVLGPGGSGKTSLIRSARPLSSVGASSSGLIATCDWWFFNTAVILDAPGRYVFPDPAANDEAEWQELLALLQRGRRREPIHGVVVVVGADVLATAPAEQLQEQAAGLRRRLDELTRKLVVACPIYLVVTKCDGIAGFREFFGSLPEPALAQAMGAANVDLGHKMAPVDLLEQGYRAMLARLDGLRLALMEREEHLGVSGRLFLFPEEVRSLGSPLRTFAEALFRQNPYQETPLFRGVFFQSAAPAGNARSRLAQRLGLDAAVAPSEAAPPRQASFAREFLTAVLPADRNLLRRPARWHERNQLARFAGLIGLGVAVVFAVGVLTLSFTRNLHALGAVDAESCPVLAGRNDRISAEVLTALDRCRESVEKLNPHTWWWSISTNFGLRHTGKVDAALRARFLETYRARVLALLDKRADERLGQGPAGPAIVTLLLRRIEVLSACAGEEGCPARGPATAATYRAWLAADGSVVPENDPRIPQLARADAAFLEWQRSPREFDLMRQAHEERVKRWLDAGGLRPEWVLASANVRFGPIRLAEFGGGLDGGPQVDAAFTRRAWKEGIAPLMEGLRRLMPNEARVEDRLSQFEATYRSETFRQWALFLAAATQAEGRRATAKEVAARLLGPESAYRRLVDSAASDMPPHVLATDAPAPAWATTMQRYAELKARPRPAAEQKAPPAGTDPAKAAEEREAQAQIAAYLEAMDALRPEFSTPEKAYKSARLAFEEGEATPKSTHPVHRARWSIEQLRRIIGQPRRDDALFWDLLARPVTVGWRAILEEAGVSLQQAWQPKYAEMIGSPPTDQAAKTMSFVNAMAGPFLDDARGRPQARRLFGEGIAFTPQFLEYHASARRISPDKPFRLEPPQDIVYP